MNTLLNNYLEKKQKPRYRLFKWFSKPNPNRIFMAQLAEVIATIHDENEENLPKNAFTHSQRIKLGALVYIEKKIENSYSLRSAGNSDLYTLCSEILNTTDEDNLEPSQQLACLAALRSSA